MGNIQSRDFQDCLGNVDSSLPVPEEPGVRLLDPRSPSENIPRTPIEFVSKKAGKSIKTDSVTPAEFLKKNSLKCQSLTDPRSPTLEFDRTPILVPAKSVEKKISPEPTYTGPSDKNIDVGASAPDDNKAEDAVMLSDPRSPTTEVSRTPIQVTDALKELNIQGFQSNLTRIGLLETDLDADVMKLPANRIGHKYMDIKNKTPDRSLYSAKDKKSMTDENSCETEKENEFSLKRKLFMTPESSPVIQAGLKVRNPLGSMSNYQQSPSLLLKMKQARKIEETARAVIYDLESTPNSKYAARKEKQKQQQVMEWDKDSTVII